MLFVWVVCVEMLCLNVVILFECVWCILDVMVSVGVKCVIIGGVLDN